MTQESRMSEFNHFILAEIVKLKKQIFFQTDTKKVIKYYFGK